jgi:predicted RNase H-like nuclease (RuvC/YqgF family)
LIPVTVLGAKVVETLSNLEKEQKYDSFKEKYKELTTLQKLQVIQQTSEDVDKSIQELEECISNLNQHLAVMKSEITRIRGNDHWFREKLKFRENEILFKKFTK